MGASGALMEEIRVKDGRVVVGALEEYPLFTNADTPDIETIILDRSDLKPSGCGEIATGPIAPAIGNAFYALTGVRLRQLPMTPERVLAALTYPLTSARRPVDVLDRPTDKEPRMRAIALEAHSTKRGAY
jgi:CO/xanthine dehydrogenase Mo-binding subunit